MRMNATLSPRPKVKLRVDDFDLLANSGALAGLERSELLDGDIYLMSPQYSRHGNAKAAFHEALLDWARAHRPDLVVRTEMSVAMPPHDEPMPDIIVCTKPTGAKGIPVGSVALLIEVANETLEHDLSYKAALYVSQGVPEYWVVDLVGRKIIQHALPGDKIYGRVEQVAFGQTVAAVTLAGLAFETAGLD
jgi:Uma2 family endonuclease